MNTGPIKRGSHIRPVYRGTRGKRARESRIRASDLPAIADALGISVSDVKQTAKRVNQ